MTLLVPKSTSMWMHYDLAVKDLLDNNKCSVDTGLLAVHALTTAKIHRSYPKRIESNAALLDLILRLKKSRNENVFDEVVNSSHNSSNYGELSNAASIELFNSIGSGIVRDSKELECLGLLLNLFANTDTRDKSFTALLRDLTDYGFKMLTMQQNPVRLNTLKVLWEHAPNVNLMGSSYLFYKTLYEQVLYSINVDPTQLHHEEHAIGQLLLSMTRSKFKSQQLIDKLHEHMEKQGMNFTSMGMEVFGQLIELGAMPFAMSVLDQYIKHSMESGCMDLYNYKHHWETKMSLSDQAKELLFEHLKSKSDYNFKDLTLLLQHAGRTEHHKVFQQLLHRVEISILSSVSDLSVWEAVNLLRNYGSIGRSYPPLVTALNNIILANVNETSIDILATAVWSSARLNDKSARYVDVAIKKYFTHLENVSVLNRNSMNTLVLMLWSMSVLAKMKEHHFLKAKNLMEAYLTHSPLDLSLQAQQLTQVWNEAQLVLRNPRVVAESHNGEIPNALKKLPWYTLSAILHDDVDSSRTHLDASRLLNRLGVSHTNEKKMSNGYVVDVFIPVSSLLAHAQQNSVSVEQPTHEPVAVAGTGKGEDMNTTVPGWLRSMAGVSSESAPSRGPKQTGSFKGVVLEFDGPHHFESYLRRETGTTVMKRRHLQALGLVVINIPFWNYNLDMSEASKEVLLSQCIARVMTSISPAAKSGTAKTARNVSTSS